MRSIDDIPWASLHHAYGPAVDVPGQLRDLCAGDLKTRSAAYTALYHNVYHQGTRWQVSASVVPLLADLVDDPSTPDRAHVVTLLTSVAIGAHGDESLPFEPERAELTPEQEQEVIRGLYHDEEFADEDEWIALGDAAAVRWAADAYDAAHALVDRFATWIADPDPAVAAHAAALVAWFPPTDRTVEALLAAAEPTVRASTNLALAHLPGTDERVDEHLRQLASSGDVFAAVALAYRMGDRLPATALTTLVEAVDRELPPEVPGWERAPRGFVALALQRLSAKSG